MTLTILTPPALEPVSLDVAKAWLRVTIDVEDDVIAALVIAARQRVEAELGLCLIATGLRETFDVPPPGPIPLSRGPLASLASVSVADSGGTYTALPDTAYRPAIGALGPVVAPVNYAWPAPGVAIDGLRIDYTAGFGVGADAVPAPLKQAILSLVAFAFDHRGEAVTAPLALAEPWLAPFRRVRL